MANPQRSKATSQRKRNNQQPPYFYPPLPLTPDAQIFHYDQNYPIQGHGYYYPRGQIPPPAPGMGPRGPGVTSRDQRGSASGGPRQGGAGQGSRPRRRPRSQSSSKQLSPPPHSAGERQEQSRDGQDQLGFFSEDTLPEESTGDPNSKPSPTLRQGGEGVQQGERSGGGAELNEAGDGLDPTPSSPEIAEKKVIECGVQGCTKSFPKSTLHQKSLATDVGTWIRGQEKKTLRKKHLSQLFVFVNACLNGGGGIVYAHVTTDMLHFLDEQLDDILMELVPDGSLFKANYERTVDDDHEHIIIRVLPGDRPLSTKAFNTVASTNKGKKDLTHLNMRNLVRSLSAQQGQAPPAPQAAECNIDLSQLERGKEIPLFHENTRMEAKSVPQKNTDAAKDGKTLINYAWSNLKLAERITTFSKEEGGGCYFLGIGEQQTDPVPSWTKVEDKFPALPGDKFGGRQIWDDTPPKKTKNAKDDTAQNKEVEDEKKVFRLARPDQVPTTQERTGRFVCEGVFLQQTEHKSLKEHLHNKIIGSARKDKSSKTAEKVKPEMMWHPPLANVEDQVQVYFHPVKTPRPGSGSETEAVGGEGQEEPEAARESQANGSFVPGCYVIQIVVKNFKGLCFTDPLGPEAYDFNHPDDPDQVSRIRWENWLKRQQDDLHAFAL